MSLSAVIEVVREEAYVAVGRQEGRNGFTDKKEVRLS